MTFGFLTVTVTFEADENSKLEVNREINEIFRENDKQNGIVYKFSNNVLNVPYFVLTQPFVSAMIYTNFYSLF